MKLDHSNPYEPPKAEPDPPPRREIDPYYRLRRFLIVVVPAIVGAFIGLVVLAPLLFQDSIGAGVGGLIGLLIGLTYRIATRRR